MSRSNPHGLEVSQKMRLTCHFLVPLLPGNTTESPPAYQDNGDSTDDNLESDDEVLNDNVASGGQLSFRFNSGNNEGVSSNLPEGQVVDGESPGK